MKFISIHSNFNNFQTKSDKIILQNVTYCNNFVTPKNNGMICYMMQHFAE